MPIHSITSSIASRLAAAAMGTALTLCAHAQTPGAAAPSPSTDPVVLRAGDIALTKSQYETLVLGFERAAGAVTTGATPQSMQSGQDVARLLAAASEAQRRKIDQTPRMQSIVQVRTYTLLSNALLAALTADARKDEAGTRALWEAEKGNYIDIRARQILVRYRGASMEGGATTKGSTRTEAQAKAEAAALHAQLVKGADFVALAKAKSDDEASAKAGGELPPFTRGATVAEFETVAFSTEVGAVSAPFKSKYGYHIVQVIESRPFDFDRLRPTLEFVRAQNEFNKIVGSNVQLNEAYFKP